jgi:hypothetical protein
VTSRRQTFPGLASGIDCNAIIQNYTQATQQGGAGGESDGGAVAFTSTAGGFAQSLGSNQLHSSI